MRLPADQRRQQLLDVARDVFAATGYHETSMDDIAEGAGVTKPVLYQHFPSKRALYLELLTDTGRQLLDALSSATERVPTGRERVEAGFRAYFQYVTRNRSGFRLLFGASIRTDSEFAAVVDGVVRSAADAISELIEIPASDEHRRVLATALVGMAESVGRRASDGVDEQHEVTDAAELAHWIAELAWFGLRGVRSEEGATLQ
ncbi:MAG TPA: TetR/AcrR family transcriptional regulator [Acidimicrobiia bacterium]|nr:TetR/AcrR family transcriptional regulator [Acidimicrobiia bacterium]